MFHGYSCFGNLGGFGWIGILVSLLLVFVVFFGIAWLIRKSFSTNQANPTEVQSKPSEILQVRYARGELSREEYEQTKADLS